MKLSFVLNRLKNAPSSYSPQHIHTRFFSTTPKPSLYRRITPLGGPNISITPILDQWLQQGNEVTQSQLRTIVKELRHYGRNKHALEVATWMTEKRYMPLSSADVALRMNLIWRIHGIREVENYFNNCASKLKRYEVYMALLNCYANEKAVEKAEETFQMMKDKKMIRTPMGYSIMMNLYNQVGNHDKLDALMAEMDENNIDHNQYTLCNRFVAYAALSDIAGMNKTVQRMKSTLGMQLNWKQWSILAKAYLKVGETGKAVEMLEKIQNLISLKRGNKDKNYALQFLLKSYARAGMKFQVFHVWELFKKNEVVYNRGYIGMVHALLLLNDVEAAEKIYKEWESSYLTYDPCITNLLIDAYCRNDLVEKAETLKDRAAARGNEASVYAWCSLTNGYLKGNQITKAKEALKRAIATCQPEGKPSKEYLESCLEILEGKDESDFSFQIEGLDLMY